MLFDQRVQVHKSNQKHICLTVCSSRPCRPGQAAYALQLCLAALQRLVQPPITSDDTSQPTAAAGAGSRGSASGIDGLDAGVVVRAARVAPDGAARNQALALLAVLARLHPQATLQHVVDVSCFHR
jgi:hypothetical protein